MLKTGKIGIWIACATVGLAILGCSTSLGLGTDPTVEPTRIGYKVYTGEGMSITLPDTFIGGNVDKNWEEIVEQIEDLGPKYSGVVTQMQENRDSFVFYAFDTNVGSNNEVVNVAVLREPIRSTVTIKSSMQGYQKQLEELCKECRVDSKAALTINQYEGGEVRVTNWMTGVEVNQLVYMVKEKRVLWTVVFSAGSDSYPNYESIFETSIQTLTIEDDP